MIIIFFVFIQVFELPDLVVRPQGIDIKLLPPYPYPHSGDIIPIRAKVFNIGGAAAYNIDVEFKVVLDEDTAKNPLPCGETCYVREC
ncbi:unnamed protein product [marine sediment metagenome]|uniref:CARDB domain-containing protein n=1 Tax=marine sediment metagenome TaxID=412755 RepID=X1KJF1_9ZZZZ